MKVLSVGLDKGLFNKKSDVFWRHQDYASWVDKYFVIVPTLKVEDKKSFVEKNLEIIPTNSWSRWLYLLDIILAAWRYRKLRFDLVTVQDPFLCGLAGVFIKYLLRTPLNIQIHSEFFNSRYFREENFFNRLCYYVGLFTLYFADTVRARNKRIKNDVTKRYPRLYGKVFSVGVRLNEVYLRPLSNVKRDSDLILNVGRLARQKNYPLLIETFKLVRKSLPNTQLLLVGDKRFARFKSSHIDFLGPLPAEKLRLLYDRASLFVLSSNHEGWGLVVLEALARGCPVVMTDTGCAGEIVIHNQTGYVVPIGEASTLAKGVVEVLSSQNKYQQLAVVGQKLVEKDSNPDFIRRSMIQMFKTTSQPRQQNQAEKIHHEN